MMPEEVYDLWAPESSPWSAWAKPVLFAALNRVSAPPELVLPEDLAWVPDSTARTAVVVDLPGEAAVLTGLALARRGYQPVPLFNGCLASGMVVDVAPLAAALLGGAERLRHQPPAKAVPPAFLLDSRRREGKEQVRPGRFDNRWAVVRRTCLRGTVCARPGSARSWCAPLRFRRTSPTSSAATSRPGFGSSKCPTSWPNRSH